MSQPVPPPRAGNTNSGGTGDGAPAAPSMVARPGLQEMHAQGLHAGSLQYFRDNSQSYSPYCGGGRAGYVTPTQQHGSVDWQAMASPPGQGAGSGSAQNQQQYGSEQSTAHFPTGSLPAWAQTLRQGGIGAQGQPQAQAGQQAVAPSPAAAASGGAAVATIAALVAARCNASAAVHWQRCRQRCAGGAGGAKRAKACAFEDRVSTVVAGRALGGRALGWLDPMHIKKRISCTGGGHGGRPLGSAGQGLVAGAADHERISKF